MPVRSGGTKRRVTKAVKPSIKRGGSGGRPPKLLIESREKLPTRNMTEVNEKKLLGLNMICSKGHKAYAPDPEYWVGTKCPRKGCPKKLKLFIVEKPKRRPKRISRY